MGVPAFIFIGLLLSTTATGELLQPSRLAAVRLVVRDITGLPIIGADVVLTNVAGSTTRAATDDRGVVTREVCLGKDGTPASAEEGVAVTVYETNADGCVTTQTRLDRDGVLRQFQPVFRLVDDIEPAGIKAQIRQLERKLVHLHATDATHRASSHLHAVDAQ